MLKGRMISKGYAEGKALKIDRPLSFLGDVNMSTGRIEAEGLEIQDKILVFPRGKGSTVGSFVMYNLKIHGKAPRAIINSSAETVIATGAVISSIPMVDFVNIDLIMNGDNITVNADEGTVNVKNIEVKELVSSAIIVNENVILFKQPEWNNLYPEKWTFYMNNVRESETLEHAAIGGIKEEVGVDTFSLEKWPESVVIRKRQTVWKINFFIFYAEWFTSNLEGKNFEYKSFTRSMMQDMNVEENVFEIIKGLPQL